MDRLAELWYKRKNWQSCANAHYDDSRYHALNLHAMFSSATPEEYIAVQERTYRKMTGRKMKLPNGDTEARAKAMLEAVAGTGAWIFDGRDEA